MKPKLSLHSSQFHVKQLAYMQFSNLVVVIFPFGLVHQKRPPQVPCFLQKVQGKHCILGTCGGPFFGALSQVCHWLSSGEVLNLFDVWAFTIELSRFFILIPIVFPHTVFEAYDAHRVKKFVDSVWASR